MTINRQVKSNLAKLLATENLTVEHANVPTASFDVQNRVLSLPIWENVSDDVYDLLVGHEVGHAIYTPNEWGDAYGIPQSYLNIVEDARIERLMKVKYPGLAKSFYRGYSELNKENFFEIKDSKIEELTFIDRINLYFKVGLHDISALIPFSDEESEYVEMVRDTETFDNVIDVCRKILEFVKQNKKQEQKIDNNTQLGNDMQNGMPSADSIATEDKSEQQEEGESEEKKESEQTNSDLNETNMGGDPTSVDEEDDDEVEESTTDDAWQKNQRKFVSNANREYIYITPPNVDWKEHIVPMEEFSSDMDIALKEISEKTCTSWDDKVIPLGQKWINTWKESYKTFKTESNKSVSFLIKEFEMKKKANEYNRSSVAKTGVLDTNKLINYKWSDDLFKKTSVIPTGKNHGLLMYIDWSGSMDDNLEGTIKQLINLVVFCKKVQIPYQVFAFVENSSSYFETFVKTETHREISVMQRFKLIEMFNSSLNTRELEEQIIRVWCLMKCINHRYDIHEHRKYELGSTPLNDTIFAGIYLFNQFKKKFKVDKINTVFLTDGESNSLHINEQKVDKTTGEVYYRRKGVQYYYDAIVCLKDPKTGYVDHNIGQSSSWQESTFKITSRLLEYYKWMTGSTVVGFRLSKPGQAGMIMSATKKTEEDNAAIAKSWKNDKYFVSKNLGYDELYVIQLSDEYMGKVSEIKADHTSTANKLRNEFRKHVKSKMFNKIILSKFVDQIA
jgi:hypothetical protein